MAKTVGFRYAIEWGNPYTPPPGDKVLLEVYETTEQREKRGGGIPHAVTDYYKANVGFGTGYAITFKAITEPIKAMGKDKLSVVRRKRLERRMRNKYPLFADEFIRCEIEKRAAYYAGETDIDIESRRNEALIEENAEYQRYQEYIKKSRRVSF